MQADNSNTGKPGSHLRLTARAAGGCAGAGTAALTLDTGPTAGLQGGGSIQLGRRTGGERPAGIA